MRNTIHWANTNLIGTAYLSFKYLWEFSSLIRLSLSTFTWSPNEKNCSCSQEKYTNIILFWADRLRGFFAYISVLYLKTNQIFVLRHTLRWHSKHMPHLFSFSFTPDLSIERSFLQSHSVTENYSITENVSCLQVLSAHQLYYKR